MNGRSANDEEITMPDLKRVEAVKAERQPLAVELVTGYAETTGSTLEVRLP